MYSVWNESKAMAVDTFRPQEPQGCVDIQWMIAFGRQLYMSAMTRTMSRSHTTCRASSIYCCDGTKCWIVYTSRHRPKHGVECRCNMNALDTQFLDVLACQPPELDTACRSRKRCSRSHDQSRFVLQPPRKNCQACRSCKEELRKLIS